MPDSPAGGGRSPAVLMAYERVVQVRRRMRRLGDGVWDGLFLGLMDRSTLTALDETFYARATESIDGRAQRYDQDGHIRSGLHDWETRAVRGAFPEGCRVIVTSAGAGREVLALLELGYDVVGYEPNARLREAGRRVLAARGDEDRLRPSERDHFPADAGRADAVVIGWGSYMLIPGRSRRVALLRAARESLPDGAPLLVSFFARPPLRYFQVVHRMGAPLRALRRDEPLELGDALSPNFVHYFSRAEIESELAEAAFACETYEPLPYAHAIARAV